MKAMTRAHAIAFFADEGYSVKSLSEDGLHHAWIMLQRKYHEGGRSPDPQKSQMVNVAYDIIKREPSIGDDDVDEDSDTDLPVDDYTVWGWDGKYVIPGFQVKCTTRDFNKVIVMARKRLRRGFNWPLGVLLQPSTSSYDNRLLLIYLNGHSVNPPLSFETESDPRVDQHLKIWLSKYNT